MMALPLSSVTLDKLLDKIPNALGWWAGHTEEGIPPLAEGEIHFCWARNEEKGTAALPLQRETATWNEMSCFFFGRGEKVF